MEFVYLTEKEATEAERCRYRSCVSPGKKKHCGVHYAETLKDFIFYLQYGIRLPRVDEKTFETFCTACERFRDKRGVA
jgi:hypothetical protein